MRFTWSTSCLAAGDGGRGAGVGCLKVLMGQDGCGFGGGERRVCCAIAVSSWSEDFRPQKIWRGLGKEKNGRPRGAKASGSFDVAIFPAGLAIGGSWDCEAILPSRARRARPFSQLQRACVCNSADAFRDVGGGAHGSAIKFRLRQQRNDPPVELPCSASPDCRTGVYGPPSREPARFLFSRLGLCYRACYHCGSIGTRGT
jgi:hypothetical protein